MFSPVPAENVGAALTTADASAASNAARCARTNSANVAAAMSTVDDESDDNDELNDDDLFVTDISVAVFAGSVIDALLPVVVDASVVAVVVVETGVVAFVLIVIVGIRAAAWVGRVADTRFDGVVVGRATTLAAFACGNIVKTAIIAPQIFPFKIPFLFVIFISVRLF